jgi:LacI family transcriptional regulator
MRTKRPTLRDVAREAGVSYQTVSRVINNDEHVAEDTRNKILKTIEQLGFRPNRAAQIMQTARSQTIEVVMPIFGFNRVLHDLAARANELGYHFSISIVAPEEYGEALANGASRFIDGFILSPLIPIIDDYDELMRLTDGVPFVQLGARLGTNIPSVIYDQAQGARLATQHLIDLGHQQIAEISGPLAYFDGMDRHESYLKTLEGNGLNPAHIIEGDFTINGGYKSMCELLDSGAKFTAVVIGNDSMAYGALTALRTRGLRVPDDISLVGFDDIPESAHFVPALTTIFQDFEMFGRLAVESLVSIIDNPKTPVYQRVLIPKLIVRETTRPLSP